MTPERYEQVCQICCDALRVEAPQRAAFLDRACAGDASLRREVEAMLVNEGRVEGFLESPALAVAAQFLAEEQAQSRLTAARFSLTSPLIFGLTLPESGPSAVSPTFIGSYRILRKLGEGGMGVVYEAEQQHPRRSVALKIIRGGRLMSDYQVKLFQREAQALARLKHPGIAAIYEAGRTDEGQHYFIMELVRGAPLLDYVKGNRLTGTQAPSGVRRRLELFLKICEAISYAHQRGVIHRDLKPANILVADESESFDGASPVGGEVKVLDFGLARITDDEGAGASGVSEAGQIRGTLPYMSPEQLRGDPGEIDVRADVYALGVILYEMLTERLPYDLEHATAPQAIRIICEEAPKPTVRMLSETRDRKNGKTGRIDRDVETIVFKALEKEPERRYRSAAAMAEDVTRYLTNQPIHARPPSALYQFRKLVARHKAPFALSAAVFALLLGFAITMAAQSARIARERDKVAQQELSNRRLLYAANMNMAMQAWEANYIKRVQELVESYIPKSGQEDMREFEWYYLWRLCHRDLLTLKGHGDYVTSVAFSPDGKKLATGSWDGAAKLWDVGAGRELATLKGHRTYVFSVAFSPDGKRLATGSWDHTAKLWDAVTGRELATLKGHGDGVWSVAFSPDGKRLATGSRDRTVKLWDAMTGRELATLKGHRDYVYSVTFSPDGKRLATGSWDHTVKLWDAGAGRELATLKGHEDAVLSVVFSPDGKMLATGSRDRTAKLWNVVASRNLATLKGHEDEILSVAFSPDGKKLATGSRDRTVKLWDVSAGRELATLKGHGDYVTSVAFSPDGKRLATANVDHTAKLWDAAIGQEPTTLIGHRDEVHSVAFSPDGKKLAAGSRDGAAKLWDAITGQELATLKGHRDGVWSVVFSPDGKMLATGGYDGAAKLWDVDAGRELATLKGHRDHVYSVAFSPNGKTLATGSRDGVAKLWDVTSGRELATLKGHGGGVYSVVFSPDGKRLVTGSYDRTARLWDAVTGQELATLKGHADGVRSIAFSPDGKMLVTGSYDRTAKLWDVDAGRELATLTGHVDEVFSAVFSPDGKRLATGSRDRTVKLWDVGAGQELVTLKGHGATVWSVAFSPDGKTLATGSGDHTVKLWRAAAEQESLAPSKR
ncbi:MAG TPA: protein kinase [Blastocatellia bacterium]|nr:protein kinase [Blastocatellia bacterium]